MEKSYSLSAIRKRKWRAEKPDLYLKNNRESRWRKIGLDIDKANQLRNTSKVCEICKIPCDNLFVDHCHKSNEIRGMLCTRCNTGLGMFNDNPSYLKEAILYLERNN